MAKQYSAGRKSSFFNKRPVKKDMGQMSDVFYEKFDEFLKKLGEDGVLTDDIKPWVTIDAAAATLEAFHEWDDDRGHWIRFWLDQVVHLMGCQMYNIVFNSDKYKTDRKRLDISDRAYDTFTKQFL